MKKRMQTSRNIQFQIQKKQNPLLENFNFPEREKDNSDDCIPSTDTFFELIKSKLIKRKTALTETNENIKSFIIKQVSQILDDPTIFMHEDS